MHEFIHMCIPTHIIHTHMFFGSHTHDREALYPYLSHHDLNEVVEDNESCHNNEFIRDEHKRRGVQLVGYEATDDEKQKNSRSNHRTGQQTHVNWFTFTHMFVTSSDSTLQTGTRPKNSEDKAN